jgi:hypothetical protein
VLRLLLEGAALHVFGGFVWGSICSDVCCNRLETLCLVVGDCAVSSLSPMRGLISPVVHTASHGHCFLV